MLAVAAPGMVVACPPRPAAGTWQLTVTVRVSAFDEYTKVLEVTVR